MNKQEVLTALKKLRSEAKERKFNQSVELIVNLKDLNLKNPDEQVEFFATIPNSFKKIKVCAIVGGELAEDAKRVCDFALTQSDLEKYKNDKVASKKLADEYDFFIAQANIMGLVAGTFGRVFGPRGKMPNPKAGCVVPPKGALAPLYERLQKTVKFSAKKFPVMQLTVGKMDMDDEKLAENILYFYDQIEHHLPKERHNIKDALVKLTMSNPVKLM
ncbi:50S ribosomal protein L1 [Candidatus Woesearchaeota archaeon]|nr:50S ribosomal protein L1 [Candidatus Woesearchaeota archaeon]